ncbi:hypothetical protein M8818_007091 [Zalaria obscura]|uniref:Uncharacterized protein n=1 Tax=Zalaria obscura TaxID=2024903 RepID=A0ACC3S528_9PEZI
MSPNIAIIGGGPAGCCLAVLLSKSPDPPSFTVFESDSAPNYRAQGGTLDLHEKTGLMAMRRMGLYSAFESKARYDGEAIGIADRDLRFYVKRGGSKGGSDSHGRPEIDRKDLREILINALPEGCVRWGHRLQKIDEKGVLHFKSGQTAGPFDLVIGADGAWSKIRPLLSSEKPVYSGVSGIRIGISNAAETHPDLYALVNRGSLFAYGTTAYGENGSVLTQQLSDGSLNTACYAHKPEDWLKDAGFDPTNLEETEGALLKEYEGWHPQLRKLLQVADQDPWAAGLYMLPIGHSWPHKKGFTCLGDAAHLMTPFAGEGVNLALADSVALADAIIAACNSSDPDALDKEVAKFEREMVERSTPVQQLTYDAMTLKYFTPGAPETTIEKYVCLMVGDQLPWFLRPVFSVAVYGYFGWFKWMYPAKSETTCMKASKSR